MIEPIIIQLQFNSTDYRLNTIEPIDELIFDSND